MIGLLPRQHRAVEHIERLLHVGHASGIACRAGSLDLPRREGLVADGQIAPERILKFALLDVDLGRLSRIIEKPDAAALAAAGPSPWVSMNLWRIDARVLAACRAVTKSARGEFELPEAIALAISQGISFRAGTIRAGVLDLSARGDIAAVAERLALLEPAP